VQQRRLQQLPVWNGVTRGELVDTSGVRRGAPLDTSDVRHDAEVISST
jgi:hypothetical protein